MRTPTTRAARLAVVALLALGVAGCDQQQVDEVRSQIEGAVDDAQSQLDDVTVPDVELTVPDVELTLPDVEVGGGGTEEQTTAPTQEATTPEPSPSPSAEPVVDEGGIAWWVWLLVVVLLGLAAWAITTVLRRRSEQSERVGRLRDESLRDTDWLLGTAREQRAESDAAPRVRDVRTRVDRLGDNLRQLESVASTKGAQAAVDLRLAATRLADAVVAELDDVARGQRSEEEGDAIRELARDTRDAAERLRDGVRGVER